MRGLFKRPLSSLVFRKERNLFPRSVGEVYSIIILGTGRRSPKLHSAPGLHNMCPRTVCVEPGGLWCQSKVVVSPLEVSRLAVCVEDTPAETWNSHRDAVSDLHALQLGLSTFTKLPSCFLSGAHRLKLWISFFFVLLRRRYVARAPYRVRTHVFREKKMVPEKTTPCSNSGYHPVFLAYL